MSQAYFQTLPATMSGGPVFGNEWSVALILGLESALTVETEVCLRERSLVAHKVEQKYMIPATPSRAERATCCIRHFAITWLISLVQTFDPPPLA